MKTLFILLALSFSFCLSVPAQKTFIVCATDTLIIDACVISFGAYDVGVDHARIDTYAVTLDPAPESLFQGMYIVFSANTKNTGAAKLNVNKLGAKPLVKKLDTPLTTGDIVAGQWCLVIYDSEKWILINANF